MSDQTITHLHVSLKELNARLQKLTRIVDRLHVLAYKQLQLSKVHKELSETMEALDVIAFEIEQELGKINSSQIFIFPVKE